MSESNKNPGSTSTLLKPLLVILLAVCVLAVIALFAIPNFNGSHSSPANACINNLRQIDAAAHQFALEHQLTNDSPINFPSDLTTYIKLNKEGKIAPCPSGGTYHVDRVGKAPTCSLGTTVTPAHVLP